MERFICDECGRPGRQASGTGWCTRCEAEYRQGIADADAYLRDRDTLGTDAAEAIQIQRELAEEGY